MKNRTKLWLIMLVSAVSSLIIFLVLSTIVGKFWNRGYDLNSLDTLSQQLLNAIEEQDSLSGSDLQPLLDQMHDEHPEMRFEWVASDGMVLYDTFGNSEQYDFKQLADRVVNMPNNLWTENEMVTLAYPVYRNGQSFYLLLSLSSEAMKSGQIYLFIRTFKVLLSFALPFVVAILVPYFLSFWFFSSINRRIDKLNGALNRVGIGTNMTLLEDKKKDEIGQLTRHYNAMAHRIQQQTDQIEHFEHRRKVLLSNLSHDLRTPLTMILGYAETIRTGSYKDENELQAGAKIILQRSIYMDKLLDQLLDISQQDPNMIEAHFASHNLSELMRKIAAEYHLFGDGQNFTVDIDIPDTEIIVDIDASLIERALRNMLDNAIRYGSEGRYLGMELSEDEKYVYMAIKDRGKGIALAEHELIFERFYRGNGSRKGEGLGLGLAIVRDVVESHHGDIQVTSTPFVETSFQIRLPKTFAASD